eukprot:597649-Prorocentrum_minimum.AAC.1
MPQKREVVEKDTAQMIYGGLPRPPYVSGREVVEKDTSQMIYSGLPRDRVYQDERWLRRTRRR